jgi:hypothetical protein
MSVLIDRTWSFSRERASHGSLKLFIESYQKFRNVWLVCVMYRLAIQRGDGDPFPHTQTPIYAVVVCQTREEILQPPLSPRSEAALLSAR